MATIINTPQGTIEHEPEHESSDTAGWVVAIILLVAVIGWLIWWVRGHGATPALSPEARGGSVNASVTLPGGTGGSAY